MYLCLEELLPELEAKSVVAKVSYLLDLPFATLVKRVMDNQCVGVCFPVYDYEITDSFKELTSAPSCFYDDEIHYQRLKYSTLTLLQVVRLVSICKRDCGAVRLPFEVFCSLAVDFFEDALDASRFFDDFFSLLDGELGFWCSFGRLVNCRFCVFDFKTKDKNYFF
ncbi:MAG: hypothetical protein [Chaetfec virus UA24_2268]|nr:MAG: hypothetical protein [Chaetfec virus UA24_2268]